MLAGSSLEKTPKLSSEAADVVVVADFDGPRAATFELVTLLFLASWMEHRGASRAWPLHLVCVGQPPASVRRLARDAGAAVVVRAPLLLNPSRTSNKLRGFEVQGVTDRILLLDADTLVLRDLSSLLAVVGTAAGAAAAVANHYAEETWRRIYALVGEPYPGVTGVCWCADARTAALRGLDEEWAAWCRRMPPYYSSGVVTAPWAADLGARWREHLSRIVPLFTSPVPPPSRGTGGLGDEHALATAFQSLRREGVPVIELPEAFHMRPLLLRVRPGAWEETRIVHHVRLLKGRVSTATGLPGLLYGQTLFGLRRYVAAVAGLRAIRSPAVRGIAPQARAAFAPLFALVHRLYTRRIQHVLG